MSKPLPAHLQGMSADERLEHEQETLKILVADTLALVMEDLDLSQADLARRLGKSAANVSKLLSGSQNLKLSTIATLCHALGVRMHPRLEAANRSGTPAEHDKPLPAWVERSDAHQDALVQLRLRSDLKDASFEGETSAAPAMWNFVRHEIQPGHRELVNDG